MVLSKNVRSVWTTLGFFPNYSAWVNLAIRVPKSSKTMNYQFTKTLNQINPNHSVYQKEERDKLPLIWDIFNRTSRGNPATQHLQWSHLGWILPTILLFCNSGIKAGMFEHSSAECRKFAPTIKHKKNNSQNERCPQRVIPKNSSNSIEGRRSYMKSHSP